MYKMITSAASFISLLLISTMGFAQPVGIHPPSPERERAIFEAVEKIEMERAPARPVEAAPEVKAPGATRIVEREPINFGVVDKVNERISPLKISGEYRAELGVKRDDIEFQDANYDYFERNWRMLGGGPDLRENTYDPGIFSRFRLNLDTDQEEGWNFHSNITVDPWSYVGKSERVTITGTGGDALELELKYWSNTGKTINETFYTSRNGDSIALPEIKVKDGMTTALSGTSIFSNVFNIPEVDIRSRFQPLRELWFDYKTEDLNFRIFPIAYGDQAYTSDDPLVLSNHHIWWEATPWLEQWIPGRVNPGANPIDFTRGRWSDDLADFTRDSDGQRLNALRGIKLSVTPYENTSISGMIASPKNIWQDYDTFDTLNGAVRVKQSDLFNALTVGGMYTFRHGINKAGVDASNHVYEIDATYDLFDTLSISGEAAKSLSRNDRRNAEYTNDAGGWAYHGGLNYKYQDKVKIDFDQEVPSYELKLAYTHFDEEFDPGLAEYTHTRSDQFWGRHLAFDHPNPKKSYKHTKYYTDEGGLSLYDILPSRFGEGIDSGRDVIRLGAGVRPCGDLLDLQFDFRRVHDVNGKYIESVYRSENMCRITPRLTSKLLLIYTSLPRTKATEDPFLFDPDTGRVVTNNIIIDGKDPALATVSTGLQYKMTDWLALEGIYEITNDSFMATGSHPMGLLNSSTVTTFRYYDDVIREPMTFLYSQGFFPLPPYKYFNIVKLKSYLMPMEDLNIKLEGTWNENRYAAGIDDNINHLGATAEYDINDKASLMVAYMFSKVVDIAKLASSGEKKFETHNNIFAEFSYKVRETGKLVFQYGEFARVSPTSVVVASPFGGYSPTLDTEHLFRASYTEEF